MMGSRFSELVILDARNREETVGRLIGKERGNAFRTSPCYRKVPGNRAMVQNNTFRLDKRLRDSKDALKVGVEELFRLIDVNVQQRHEKLGPGWRTA